MTAFVRRPKGEKGRSRLAPPSKSAPLPWHAACTPIVACGLKCYHPSGYDHPVLSYEIFYLYILCASVTLNFDLFSPKLGHVKGELALQMVT